MQNKPYFSLENRGSQKGGRGGLTFGKHSQKIPFLGGGGVPKWNVHVELWRPTQSRCWQKTDGPDMACPVLRNQICQDNTYSSCWKAVSTPSPDAREIRYGKTSNISVAEGQCLVFIQTPDDGDITSLSSSPSCHTFGRLLPQPAGCGDHNFVG